MPHRATPSPSPASTSMRGAGCSSLLPPLGHQEYFLLRSSMLKLFLLGLSSSGSQVASDSIICPTHMPTPSMAASIQLKGEMASWNRVPQKAVSIQIPHPLYLTTTITRTRTVTVNLRAPQTSSISDRKNIIGPTTLGLLNLFRQLKTPSDHTRNYQSIWNKSATLLTEPGINPSKVQASRFILRAYA